MIKKLLLSVLFLTAPVLAICDPGDVTVINTISPKNNAFQNVVRSTNVFVSTQTFNKNLTPADVNLQHAMNTIDQLTVSGGGASALEVFNNFTGTKSSPTASIGMSNAFAGSVTGSTFTFALNSASVTLQGVLLAGSNISLTPGAGTLTIASTGGGGGANSAAYGSIYLSSGSIVQNVTTSPSTATVFNVNGDSSTSIPDFANSRITVSTSGPFFLFANVISTFTNPSSNQSIYYGIRVNGATTPITCQDLPNATCVMSGVKSLNSGDVVSLYVSASVTSSVTTNDAQLLVASIGGSGSGGGSGTPGGSNTQFQFNNASAFAGSPDLTTNGSTITATNVDVSTLTVEKNSTFVNVSTFTMQLTTMTFQTGTNLILQEVNPNTCLGTNPSNVVISTPCGTGSGGATSPGGSDTQVQFNNSGSFGGSSTFTFTPTLLHVSEDEELDLSGNTGNRALNFTGNYVFSGNQHQTSARMYFNGIGTNGGTGAPYGDLVFGATAVNGPILYDILRLSPSKSQGPNGPHTISIGSNEGQNGSPVPVDLKFVTSGSSGTISWSSANNQFSTANQVLISSNVAVQAPATISQISGSQNGLVITATGTGNALLVTENGLPSGGYQNQSGAVTISNVNPNNASAALMVLTDSTTDNTNGDGLLEIWENNPAHNSYLLWIHGASTRNSDEPIRFDGPTYGIDEVSTSTDAAHGKGKWKVISTALHSEKLQLANSRSYDNSTFEHLLEVEPLTLPGTPAGLYLDPQDLSNDSGILTSSDTSVVAFTGRNGSTVGLTGPLDPIASWQFALPNTFNNQGQVLYQADNGRGNNNNARSWAFTTGGTTGNVLQFNSGSAPTWVSASGGTGSTVYNATSTAGFPFGFSASTAAYTSSVTVQGALSIGTTTAIGSLKGQVHIVSPGNRVGLVVQDPPCCGNATGSVDFAEFWNDNGVVLSSVAVDGSFVTQSSITANSGQIASSATIGGSLSVTGTGGVSANAGGFGTTGSGFTSGSGNSIGTLTNSILELQGNAGSAPMFQAIDNQNRGTTQPTRAAIGFENEPINQGLNVETFGYLALKLATATVNKSYMTIGAGFANLSTNATDYLVVNVSTVGSNIGSVGIGVQDPQAPLDIQAATSSIQNIFSIRNTTGSVVVDVSTTGYISSVSSTPALSSCGTSTITGSDTAFSVSVSGSPSSCTATFAYPKTNTPTCVVSGRAPGAGIFIGYTVSNTGMTFTESGIVTSLDSFDVICIGHD